MIYYALWNKAKPISSHHGKYHHSRKWKQEKIKYHPGLDQTCKLSNKISEPDAAKDEW